uniref:KIB1-4 beta-propeller domain-containing protein n=1 Tax=Aegilops tauschii TaxID=37682 RepID=M8C0R5_AEGTA
MRSTEDDIVAVATNNWNCPVILCHPGRPGAWVPGRREKPYASVFDIVFHKDGLYGITERNDLVVMDLNEDDNGIPIVKDVRYVIKHPSDEEEEEMEEYDEDGEVYINYEEEEEYDEDEEVYINNEEEEYDEDAEVPINIYDEEVEYNAASSVDEENEDFEEVFCGNDAFNDDMENHENNLHNCDHKQVPSNKDKGEVDDVTMGIIDKSEDDKRILSRLELKGKRHDGDEKVPDGMELVGFHCDDQGKPGDGTETSRHLFESNGKLLLVKRQQCHPGHSPDYTRQVEVLEADMGAGVWTPISADVSGMFFVSSRCSKHVSASEEARKGFKCHFVDEHDMAVDLKSQRYLPWVGKPTWFFPQKIVV